MFSELPFVKSCAISLSAEINLMFFVIHSHFLCYLKICTCCSTVTQKHICSSNKILYDILESSVIPQSIGIIYLQLIFRLNN